MTRGLVKKKEENTGLFNTFWRRPPVTNRDWTNYLAQPAPYMENEKTRIKQNPFLKKATVGNVRKQTCEFTHDLNLLSHLTHQMKSATKKLKMKDSRSL